MNWIVFFLTTGIVWFLIIGLVITYLLENILNELKKQNKEPK